mgnify:CR=1 FL=1|jgi:hypothetical protein
MEARKVWLSLKTPLTMLVLLAFVLGVGAWGYKQAVTPMPKRPADPCVVQQVGPEFTAANAWIRIYNGTTTSNLAKNTKLIFGNAGFHVFKIATAEAPVEKTYVAGVDAKSPEVVLLLSYFPEGTPFVADAVHYADHTADVFLGADFKAANISAEPVTSVPLPDGKACIPVIKSVNTDS